MKAEMLLKLLDAGYTKTDIDMMEELEGKPEVLPAVDPQPEAEPEPKANASNALEELEPEPTAENNVAETLKTLTETVQSLAQTVKAMQQANVKNAESEPPKRFSTEDALKDFFGEKKKA